MLKFISRVLVAGTFLGVAAAEINSPDRKNKRRLAEENKHNQAAYCAAVTLEGYAVTCHCGGLAIPIGPKGNMLRCIRCDKQFISGKYNLEDMLVSYTYNNHYIKQDKMNMDYYNYGVKLLKEKHESNRSSI